MSNLDKVLDDALMGFDDEDEGFQPRGSMSWGTTATFSGLTSVGPSPAAAVPETAVASSSSNFTETAADTASQASSSGIPAPAAHGSKQTAGASSSPAAASPAAAAAPGSSSSQGKNSSLQFDPLKRKKKGKAATAAGAGAAADLGSAGSSGSSSNSRPALTPQVQQLQEDLAKLVNEWSQALHPEAEDAAATEAAAAATGGQQRGTSSVLQALAQQTQRTVEEQSRLRPPPSTTAAAAAAGGAGGGEQMHMIVDVVMQHLLSKEVLYQPMKEIMEKYPPWLDKQTAAGSSSSLSPDDLERYKHQYGCITRLCQAYETEPENTAKIMQLLQEMQACGEPPAEIVEEMSSAIAADMPNVAAGGGAGGAGAADMNFDGLDFGDVDLADLPQDLKNCPVQ